jgi:MFS family permease
MARPGSRASLTRRSWPVALGSPWPAERGLGWLWSAYSVSTYGTWIAFGAFPLIAIRVLHSPAFGVSLLEAAGLAVAAIVAFPLGPWVEHRAKRPVMIAMDLIRFLAMASVPIAYVLGLLSYGQPLIVSVVSGTASIAFTAASGAYLKCLIRSDHLLAANGRFEGTSWVATAAGPPLGGALIGLLGPVITVTADALSYLLSALGVLRIRGGDVAHPATRPPHCTDPTFLAAGGSFSATIYYGACSSTQSWSAASSWPPSRSCPYSCWASTTSRPGNTVLPSESRHSAASWAPAAPHAS